MIIEDIYTIAQFLLPVLGWVAWANFTIKQNRKDIDLIYWEKRGRQGRRDRSLWGRIKRAAYSLRG